MANTRAKPTRGRPLAPPSKVLAAEPDAPPLSAADYKLVDRALHRLHEAMREFWSAWPIDRRNATQLARELKVDRTTCQRLAGLAREGYRAAAMIETMPGPKALRIVIDAADDVDAPPSQRILKNFRAAVDGFEEQLHNTTGSVSQLKRRFAAAAITAAPRDASERLDPQEALFHAARRITGRHVRTISSIGIYDTLGVAHDQLRHLRATVNHGIVARPDAVPMVLEAFDGTSTASADAWQRHPTILADYTNAAWTTVELPSSAGFASSAIEIIRSDEPSDVCVYTAFPVPHPRTLDHPVEESWFILYSPAATLIFDLYLHESIARQCLLALDVHLWQTSFANAPHGKWHTRLPQQPTIIQLGRGLNRAATEHYAAQRELTHELFKRANADPDEYIAFRCAEPYPMWRTGYRFELDFGRGD